MLFESFKATSRRHAYEGNAIRSRRRQPHTDGAVANIATFHQSITNGDYSNPTVAESVRSNLTTILGRTAAYRQDMVTWDQLMRKREKLAADMRGLRES